MAHRRGEPLGEDAVPDAGLGLRCMAARTVPGRVRTLVDLRLVSWGLDVLCDDVTLIASELVTNAIRHTPEQEIRVRFTREADGVLLAVWDASDVLPMRKRTAEAIAGDMSPDASALEMGHDGGRGLPIVEMLSSECGVTVTDPEGKWVWARVTA
ncbi:ATP-binding protein [Actinomadura sp. 3N508]|uniref:ATP-binding protein n=1 Tax=Actinomadura sp. 3N508 TaxID=3375153 RepID=UPI003793724B